MECDEYVMEWDEHVMDRTNRDTTVCDDMRLEDRVGRISRLDGIMRSDGPDSQIRKRWDEKELARDKIVE